MTNYSDFDLEVGQELFVVDSRRNGGEFLKVEKIGNKYFYINGDKFCKDSKREYSNYQTYRTAYKDEESFIERTKKSKLYSKLRNILQNDFSGSVAERLTTEDIETFLDKLEK